MSYVNKQGNLTESCCFANIAGWSSLEARRAHNPKVIGSNPIPATTLRKSLESKVYLDFSFLLESLFQS